jgi:hypothetical protein
MSQTTAAPATPGSAQASTATDTRLHGRWLFTARAGWIALTLLILAFSAVAIPNADAVLQSVCQPGAPCLAIQLTAYDLRLLHQLGLSPGFLAAYQVGWDVGTVLIYTALAALIFWRRSSDRMALFCAYTLVATSVTDTGLLDDGLRPLAPFWYWPVGVLEFLGLVSFFTFFLLFPSGRFAPRWTRWLVLVIILSEAYYVFITNPLLASTGSGPPFDFLMLAIIVFSLVALQLYRYRRVSTSRERQQTKWVVFGCSVAFVGAIVSFALLHFFPDELVQSSVFQTLAINTLSDGFFLLIPISIAVAILRSRLYDIDTIINKALVYGLLTGLLGALYAGLIIGLEDLAGAITGGQTTNQPVALVISTLAIAALFLPVRRRIQSLIDRRFYRKKYDAEKALAAFSATLRNEVDLEQIRAQLIAVVQETMQPAHVSLWLRQPERHPTNQAHRLEPPGSTPTKLSGD